MKKQVKIKGQLIDYLYKKNKRSKRMKISYCQQVGLVVTVPWYANRWLAEGFIVNNSDWVLRIIEKAKNNPFANIFKDKKYLDYKEQARVFIAERLAQYTSLLGVNYDRVFIKNQKKVWGSCSSKKNLNFNYKLLFLDEELADYVVVHELCHLREMNHSKRFWDLVESIFPDYSERRKELKKIQF